METSHAERGPEFMGPGLTPSLSFFFQRHSLLEVRQYAAVPLLVRPGTP